MKSQKNKIDYIGTIEDPELTELKKKYVRMSSKMYDYLRWDSRKEYGHITYMDQNYIQQFRRETWEKIDEHTFRIQYMIFLKDNREEGESIHVTWE